MRQHARTEGWITSKDVVDRACAGNTVALDVLEDAAKWIGQAFGSIPNLLNLEACIVGGGLSQAGDTLLEPVWRYFRAIAGRRYASEFSRAGGAPQ